MPHMVFKNKSCWCSLRITIDNIIQKTIHNICLTKQTENDDPHGWKNMFIGCCVKTIFTEEENQNKKIILIIVEILF